MTAYQLNDAKSQKSAHFKTDTQTMRIFPSARQCKMAHLKCHHEGAMLQALTQGNT